jgi:peptidoglycan hydrolase FlgJ
LFDSQRNAPIERIEMQLSSVHAKTALGQITQPETKLPGVLQSEAGNGNSKVSQKELREAFDDFVGQTFYSQMLSAMRKTVDKPAYFHGGQAEEVFQAQLDQTLSERLADATAEQFTGPMFDLFNMPRR